MFLLPKAFHGKSLFLTVFKSGYELRLQTLEIQRYEPGSVVGIATAYGSSLWKQQFPTKRWYTRICQITAIFIVNIVIISQRPEFSFDSGNTLYNSTIFLCLEVYFVELRCIYKEVAQLDAENIFVFCLICDALHVGD